MNSPQTRWREQALAGAGRTPTDATLPEMEGLWDQAKAAERKAAE